MSQAVRSTASTGATRSPWVVGSFAATVAILFTTFSRVIEVPVVSSYVGGTLLEITSYIGGLSTQYAPWLSRMMAEATGTSTARLLRVGSVALVGLEGVAVAALAALVLHFFLFQSGRTRAARIFGLLGFSLAMVVPALMFAVARFVAWQMANQVVALHVLDVPCGPVIQLAAAVAGLACVLLSTRKQLSLPLIPKENRHE